MGKRKLKQGIHIEGIKSYTGNGVSNKEYHREYHKRYMEKNGEKERLRVRLYWKMLREKAIELLGNKCVNCGFSDKRALQIDHINGGGRKDKRNLKGKQGYLKTVIESILSKENKYQLLCANCNWIKRVENGEENSGKHYLKAHGKDGGFI